jgi:hypothetical protein
MGLRANTVDGGASGDLSFDQVDDSVDLGKSPAQVVQIVASQKSALYSLGQSSQLTR